MSLTGSQIGVDSTFLAEVLHDQGTLDRISGADSVRVNRSCDIAADEFRAAAIKGGYSSTDLDALTSTTLHIRWREYVAWWAIDDLAVGIGVPEDLRNRCTEAKKHFSFLATGNETIDGLSRTTTTGGSQVRINAPDSLVFDGGSSTNVTGLRWRDPQI
jgi:hypothetical protein